MCGYIFIFLSRLKSFLYFKYYRKSLSWWFSVFSLLKSYRNSGSFSVGGSLCSFLIFWAKFYYCSISTLRFLFGFIGVIIINQLLLQMKVHHLFQRQLSRPLYYLLFSQAKPPLYIILFNSSHHPCKVYFSWGEPSISINEHLGKN